MKSVKVKKHKRDGVYIYRGLMVFMLIIRTSGGTAHRHCPGKSPCLDTHPDKLQHACLACADAAPIDPRMAHRLGKGFHPMQRPPRRRIFSHFSYCPCASASRATYSRRGTGREALPHGEGMSRSRRFS